LVIDGSVLQLPITNYKVKRWVMAKKVSEPPVAYVTLPVNRYPNVKLSSPRRIVSVEELQSIIPADVLPPSDERVSQILEEARWKRLNREPGE
jgi:hypothetical protein